MKKNKDFKKKPAHWAQIGMARAASEAYQGPGKTGAWPTVPWPKGHRAGPRGRDTSAARERTALAQRSESMHCTLPWHGQCWRSGGSMAMMFSPRGSQMNG
jgi:hypothetical protein